VNQIKVGSIVTLAPNLGTAEGTVVKVSENWVTVQWPKGLHKLPISSVILKEES